MNFKMSVCIILAENVQWLLSSDGKSITLLMCESLLLFAKSLMPVKVCVKTCLA